MFQILTFLVLSKTPQYHLFYSKKNKMSRSRSLSAHFLLEAPMSRTNKPSKSWSKRSTSSVKRAWNLRKTMIAKKSKRRNSSNRSVRRTQVAFLEISSTTRQILSFRFRRWENSGATSLPRLTTSSKSSNSLGTTRQQSHARSSMNLGCRKTNATISPTKHRITASGMKSMERNSMCFWWNFRKLIPYMRKGPWFRMRLPN